MSDKNKIPLVDRGWSQMSDILESELPKKKKRRAFFWFFLLGIVLIGTLSIIYLKEDNLSNNVPKSQFAYNLEDKTPISELTDEKVKIPSNSPELNKSDINHGVKSTSDIITKDYGRIDEGNTMGRQLVDPVKMVNSMNELEVINTNNKIVNKLTKKVSKPSDSSGMDMFMKSNSKEKTSQILIRTSSEISNVKVDKERQSNRMMIANLEYLKNKDLSIVQSKVEPNFFNNPNPNIDVISGVEASNTGMKAYAFVSGMYDVRPSGIGYQVGLGLSKNTNGLSLFSELGYGKINYNPNIMDSEVSVVSVSEVEGTAAEYSADGQTLYDIRNTVIANRLSDNTWLNDLNFISLKIGAEKSILGRFSLTADASYTRFLNISNSELRFGTQQSSDPSQDLALTNYNIEEKDLYNDGTFTKSEWSASLGSAYKISSRFDLILSYRLGLSNIYNNITAIQENIVSSMGMLDNPVTTPTLYRNGIELKLKYRFL